MTRIAVFRARALTMAARPHPPSTAIAILVGLDRVARRVSLIKSQLVPSPEVIQIGVTFLYYSFQIIIFVSFVTYLSKIKIEHNIQY